jgi:hypothetical protein
MQQLSDDLFLKYFKSSSSITSPQSSPLDVAKNPLPNQTKIRFLVEGKEYPSPGLAFEAAIELTRKNKEKNLATNAPTSRSQESMDTITKKQNNGS